jgi:effector-binding domain-containing protein
MPQIRYETSERRRLACLDAKGPYDKTIGPTIGRLMQWVIPRGYSPGGAVIGIYHDSPQDVPLEELRCTIGVPVHEDAEGEGEFYIQTMEPREEAVYLHKGPYDDLTTVYGAIIGDIFGSGRRIAGPPMEVYLTDPSQVPPEEWLTEIRFPIARD